MSEWLRLVVVMDMVDMVVEVVGCWWFFYSLFFFFFLNIVNILSHRSIVRNAVRGL